MARTYIRYEFPNTPSKALNAVLVVNVLVFMLWQYAADSPSALQFMSENFLVSADHLWSGRIWTLVTSEFSHIASAHLMFNLFAIWMFGRDVERVVGPRGFLHLYLAGAVMASLGHAIYGAVTGSAAPALGASGAAMSILAVSALLFPNRTLLLFFIIPVPAWLAVLLIIGIDLAGMMSPAQDSIAHAAHLGGAAYGAVYYRYQLGPYLKERLQTVGVRRVVYQDPPDGGL